MVKGEGPLDAKIVIVGEAPGKMEEAVGRPFVGFAGKLLTEALQSVGLSRGECYITNVVKEMPPNNDISVYFLDVKQTQPTQTLHNYISALKAEISAISPNIVVALGRTSLFALTGNTEITKYRGSVLESTLIKGLKVIASIHPAMVLRVWRWKSMLLADLAKAKRESQSPYIHRPHRNFIIQPTMTKIEEFLYAASDKGIICIDIETYRQQKRPIKCIGVGFDTTSALCIPISTFRGHYWTEEEEAKIWKLLDATFKNVKTIVIHNALFDLFILADLYKVFIDGIKERVFDTMIASHSIYPEMPKSLEFLCSLCSDEPYYKDEGAEATEKLDDITLWNYCCKDVVVTMEVKKALEKDLTEADCWDIFRFQIKAIEPALFLSMKGLKIDENYRAKAISIIDAQIDAESDILQKEIGKPINVNSPKQVISFLRELGYNIKSSRKDELESLADKYDIPILNLIISIRNKIKVKSTYLQAPSDNGRFKFQVKITGTETGRWSASENLYGLGGNIQSFPRGEFRKMLVADEGYILVGCDLRQAEARAVAYLSNDERLIQTFEAGKDVYREIASAIFGKQPEEVTSSEVITAKRLTHASNYRIGHRGFAKVARISQDKASKLIEAYYKERTIKDYYMWVERQLSHNRVLRTPYFNRRRVFYDRWGDSLFREAYAYIPQSLVSDINTKLLIETYYKIGDDADILITGHDAVVVQVKEAVAEKVKEEMKKLGRVEVNINGRTLVIPLKFAIGRSWYDVS